MLEVLLVLLAVTAGLVVVMRMDVDPRPGTATVRSADAPLATPADGVAARAE